MQFLLVICLGLILAVPPAHAAASPYQPQLALITAGHSNEAYSQLRPRLLGSAGNPQFDTAFGLAALDTGATAEAVTALERVLAVDPSNLPVRTELARAYAQLGDTAAAKRELDLVKSQPSTPPKVRENLSNYTTVLDESLSGGPRTINAEVNVSTGYDSNINTATTSSYLIVPALAALGPARIPTGSQSQSSAYTEASANLTIRQPLTLSRALFASIGTSQKNAFEDSSYNQTTLNAEAGMQFNSPDSGRLTLGLSAQEFWFGGEDYTRTIGLGANWQLPLTPTANLTAYGTASHITYLENSAQTANRGVVGITLDNRWSTPFTPYAFAGAYTGTEQTEDNSADYFSNNLVGLQAGFELFPETNISLYANARYEIRDYAADYPLFMQARLDHQLDLTTGATYALTPQWALRPSLAYRNASSNIGFYNYTRWLASLGLRYRFP